MKKIIALLLALATLFAFASCGISDDPDEVKKELEDAGYDVDESDDYSEFNSFLNRMGVSGDGVLSVIVAYDEKNDDDMLIVLFCSGKGASNDRKVELEAYLESDDFEDDAELMEWDVDEYEVKRSGSVVCFGTAEMIKVIA